MNKKHDKKKISVIVPVYNQEKFIARCIRSLTNQSMPGEMYEIIVVDDGSTDRTPFILDVFDEKIKIIKNNQNLGLPAALNIGISASNAPFFVRVDSDDFVTSKFLDFLYTYLDLNAHFDAIACDYLLLDDEEKVISRCDSSIAPIACGIMFRKKQVLKVGLYDEHFRSNEEKEFRIRFESEYKIEHLALPLYRYRRHDNNMTNDLAAMDKYDKDLILKHGLKKK